MPISTTSLGTSLAVATALALAAAPAGAQLLGGGLGGAVSMPGTMIGGSGDFGVSRIGRGVSPGAGGNVETPRRVRQPAVPSATSVAGTISTRATVPTSPLASAAASVRTATPAVTGAVSSTVSNVAGAASVGARVAVPAIPAVPDLAVRHAAIIDAGIAPVVYDDVPAYVERQYVVLQDELRGTGVNVRKQGQQIVLDLPSDVNFAFDKSDIQPRFYHTLNAVSRVLAHYPATYVDVNGHTDAIGSYGYNQALSERRADAVADYLADRSVSPVRMHVQGFGKTEPIASNATVQGRAANRRVEIVLTPVEA